MSALFPLERVTTCTGHLDICRSTDVRVEHYIRKVGSCTKLSRTQVSSSFPHLPAIGCDAFPLGPVWWQPFNPISVSRREEKEKEDAPPLPEVAFTISTYTPLVRISFHVFTQLSYKVRSSVFFSPRKSCARQISGVLLL